MVSLRKQIYQHEQTLLHGWMALPDDVQHAKPAVLVVHDWSGCNEMAIERARSLAVEGYIGFAVDMYGEGRVGQNNTEKQALMSPLMSDRALLRARMLTALNVLRAMPEVKQNAIAAIGFCFGGLCVLDLARMGLEVQAVVSFHGLLNRATDCPEKQISARILVLHGYHDPMVQPQDLLVFAEEMDRLAANWQVNIYGQAYHAFTNPLANDEHSGLIYNAEVSNQAFQAMSNLFQEVLL